MKASSYLALGYVLTVAVFTLSAAAGSALLFNGAVSYLIVLLLLSGLTYRCYAKDKRAARLAQRRTPERTLHILALLGGWPGAVLAQTRLRHKTQKQPFKIFCWLTILGHLLLIALLYKLYSLALLDS